MEPWRPESRPAPPEKEDRFKVIHNPDKTQPPRNPELGPWLPDKNDPKNVERRQRDKDERLKEISDEVRDIRETREEDTAIRICTSQYRVFPGDPEWDELYETILSQVKGKNQGRGRNHPWRGIERGEDVFGDKIRGRNNPRLQ